MVSIVIESVLLALAGGLIGRALAYLVFNGIRVSTLNGASFRQVVFDFAVTPDLLLQGIVAALIIGFVGGFFPAIRAARPATPPFARPLLRHRHVSCSDYSQGNDPGSPLWILMEETS